MKIAFISLGCSKNLINTEQMMALCRGAGHTVTGEPEGADVAVLNTCGFIDAAKVSELGNLPSKEQLLAQLLSVLNGNLRGLACALNEIAEKKGGKIGGILAGVR